MIRTFKVFTKSEITVPCLAHSRAKLRKLQKGESNILFIALEYHFHLVVSLSVLYVLSAQGKSKNKKVIKMCKKKV